MQWYLLLLQIQETLLCLHADGVLKFVRAAHSEKFVWLTVLVISVSVAP